MSYFSNELYLGIVLVAGYALYRIFLLIINRTEARSIARLKRFRFPEIAPGHPAPDAPPLEEKRSEALESVDNQFSIIRRTFFAVF